MICVLCLIAYKYAEKSLQVNENSPDTHKWFAITSGARGQFLSTKERIASGKIFKKHIDTALKFSPNDATLHHLLGRFCFEISGSWFGCKISCKSDIDIATSCIWHLTRIIKCLQLSVTAGLTWIERKVAATLFGAVPESSYQEALEHFEYTENLHDSGWKENRLFIVKCLEQLNKLEDVPGWIRKGLELQTNSADVSIVNFVVFLEILNIPNCDIILSINYKDK